MSKRKEIGEYMVKKINYWKENAEPSTVNAELARLRKGVGHMPGDLPELYGILLKTMPHSFWSSNGNITEAEWSCYIGLTMFAWHQQGNDIKTHCVHTPNHISLGHALRQLVHDSSAEERMRNKLQMLITSNDMNEFSYHLKNIITFIRNEGIRINYADLAEDIYAFQFEESRNRVCLKLGFLQ